MLVHPSPLWHLSNSQLWELKFLPGLQCPNGPWLNIGKLHLPIWKYISIYVFYMFSWNHYRMLLISDFWYIFYLTWYVLWRCVVIIIFWNCDSVIIVRELCSLIDLLEFRASTFWVVVLEENIFLWYETIVCILKAVGTGP